MTTQTSWYAVQTKPGQEKKVIFYLAQKGIITYFPQTESLTYRGFKKFTKVKPLFPGYLFAHCGKKPIYMVSWTRGVRKVLWENTRPQPLVDDLIEAIKSLENKKGLIQSAQFQEDKIVKIKTGPFKDILALFHHWESDKERVCLLLKVIHAQIRISVPVGLVESA